MFLRHFALSLTLIFAFTITSPASAQEAATSSLSAAIGKSGEIWESFYKFVAFIDGGKATKLVYQNMDQYELHQDYLTTLPRFKGLSRDQIDGLTYRPSPDRVAYTGVLVIHAGDDGIHRSRFSMAMEETPSAALVAEIHSLIKKSAEEDQLGTAFDFELLPHQEKGFGGQIAALKSLGIDLYASSNEGASISYTEAWNTGTLITVQNQEDLDAKLQEGTVGPGSIVFAKEALREIPAVAGVISGVPLTPSSHTVLLSQMYGIPVAFFREADKSLAGLDGRLLFLAANGSPLLPMERRNAEFSLDPSANDLEKLAQLKAKPQLNVPFLPDELDIRLVQELTQKNVGAFGGKASQMGALMRRLPNNSVKKALGIPLGYSRRFLDTAKASNGQSLSAFIAAQLATLDDVSVRDVRKVDPVTSLIQKEIKKAAFPAEDLNNIEKALLVYFTDPAEKLRFRSSSNVEDGNEFNGAGLYDSTGVWLRGPERDDVAKKLKKVIASLYNTRAYMARRRFGVDESRVGMGILVHPAFIDEPYNGVIRAIVDPQRNYYNFEVVSMKEEKDKEGEQVTHATGSRMAEVLTGRGDYATKETSDNLNIEQPYEGYSKQRSLLPSAVYKKLGAMMAEIAREYDEPGKTIDIESEFKVMKAADGLPDNVGEVFIKQVRRVPHPTPRKTTDGSSFIVLANKISYFPIKENLTSAYGDLWMPRKIDLDLETFTEAQIKAGKIHVKSASFEIRGHTITVANPVASAKIDEEYGGYKLSLALPNEFFPGLRLEIGNSNAEPRVHALTSPSIHVSTQIPAQDLRILARGRLNEDLHGFYQPDKVETIATATGGYSIEIARRGGTIRITSAQTQFFGDGDGRSVRLGNTQLSGIWRRALSLPASAIGYGANHHQGDESFVIDLFADPALTKREKVELGRNAGRYLYLLSEGYGSNGSRALLIKENGETKNLGEWKATR